MEGESIVDTSCARRMISGGSKREKTSFSLLPVISPLSHECAAKDVPANQRASERPLGQPWHQKLF
jgi:hypothetical protein